MESTFFTTLSTNEEANLSGGASARAVSRGGAGVARGGDSTTFGGVTFANTAAVTNNGTITANTTGGNGGNNSGNATGGAAGTATATNNGNG